jgi:hypothetical protein
MFALDQVSSENPILLATGEPSIDIKRGGTDPVLAPDLAGGNPASASFRISTIGLSVNRDRFI